MPVRPQTIPSLPSGVGDSNATLGRHAAFASIYLADQLVGLGESITFRQSNGTRYQPSIGSDWNEKIRGQRLWSGSMARFAVRTQDFFQLAQQIYPNVSDIDFSQIDFDFRLHFSYESITGGTTYEDIWWILHTATITDHEMSFAGATEIEGENVTFIAKGFEAYDARGFRIANPSALWGTGGTSAPNNNAAAAAQRAPSGGSGGNSAFSNLIQQTGGTLQGGL